MRLRDPWVVKMACVALSLLHLGDAVAAEEAQSARVLSAVDSSDHTAAAFSSQPQEIEGVMESLSSVDSLSSIPAASSTVSTWATCHSALGCCSLAFPKEPSRLADKSRDREGAQEIHYDAFVTPPDGKETYMLLVTKYPDSSNEMGAKMALEGFLNNLINRSTSNELLSAQMSLVFGYESLDFLIKAGTQFFKGRAVIAKNKLYLMAMECEIPSYSPENYEKFIRSFQFNEEAAN